jgi:hypothetical protein
MLMVAEVSHARIAIIAGRLVVARTGWTLRAPPAGCSTEKLRALRVGWDGGVGSTHIASMLCPGVPSSWSPKFRSGSKG